MLENSFLEILNMSFTGSIVILFVLLARLLLKKAPTIFSYALWSVVLFRLVCPFSFESMFSLLPTKASPIAQNIVYMQTPTIDTGLAIINDAVNELLPTATPAASVNPLHIWVIIGSMIWVIGIIFLLSYSLGTLLQLKKRLKTATSFQDNIFLSDKIETAFVLGALHPKIYLPDHLTDGQREHILLHEQTHIKRFDHLVKLLSFFVLCLHWFNPLAWVAFFASSKDMEMSCDDAVVKKLGSDIKKDYSTSLLTLATGKRIVGGTPLAFGESDTKGRIKNVLSYKKPAFWVILMATVAVICFIVGLISNPKNEDIAFAGVNAVILEIDKNNQSMTVEGIDENSVIGDRCIVTWEKDALITLATSSKPMQLSIDDFSVGDSIVLFIGEVQESYPTRATASSIQLQPNGARELGDLRPMVMINGALYLDTGNESPMGAANQVDGTIKTNVSPNKKPAEHEQSNFGFVGSEYVIGDGFVQVNIDGKWIVFELEKQDVPTAEYAIARLDKNGVLSWGTATNVQLAQDILMNALVKSAAWEGVDVATLKEYFLIRQTFPKTDEVHDYYAYLLPDGTAVLQSGVAGQYSVLSESLYTQLVSSFNSTKGLFFWVKPDESLQVIGETAAAVWLKSFMRVDTPAESRISDYAITDVTVIVGDPKQDVKWEDMAYQYIVQVTYDITTVTEQYFAPGDGISGKGTFQNLFRELCVKIKSDDGGGYYIVSVGTGGAVQEFD